MAALASETTRIFDRAKGKFEFELRWFSVDLGGEISAFNSKILVRVNCFIRMTVQTGLAIGLCQDLRQKDSESGLEHRICV